MKDTYFGLDDVSQHRAIDRLAKGYRWDEEKATYAEVPWPVQPEGAGAGEINCTALDYAAFLRCMIRKTGPISEKGHEELVKPRMVTGDEPKPFHSHSLYALGWEVETYRGETIVGHGGATSGYQSKMLYLPQLEWGVVIFGNSLEAGRAEEAICSVLVDDLLNVLSGQRFDWERHWKEEDEKEECNAKVDLYPQLPETPIPPTLPLSCYAGSYRHDGYGVLVVEYKNGALQVDATDRTWRLELSFKHVSGEFFVIEYLDIDTLYKDIKKAQFRLDVEGTVRELGINFVDELEDEICFRRGVES